jgi:hypothetical protein
VSSISADAFQSAARGKASGLTDDGPTGYLFYEDRRNPRYNIALYENVGLIPAERVYQEEKAGLVQSSLAQQWRSRSPLWAIEQARLNAENRAKLEAAGGQAPTTTTTLAKVPSIEFSVMDNGDGTQDFWLAKTSTDSQGADGPHPGVTLVGLDFMTYSGGQTYQQLGLPRPMLAYQPDGKITPAVEEWQSAVQMATQGSLKAQRARAFFGLGPPPSQGVLGSFRNLFG